MNTPTDPSDSHRQAVRARDNARLRLRRLTQFSVALVVALGGGFAALAAASTHTKKASTTAAAPPSRPLVSLAAAPAPPLVAVQSADEASPASAPACGCAGSLRAAAGRRLRRIVSAGVASTSFPALGTSALVAVTDRRKLPIAEMLPRGRGSPDRCDLQSLPRRLRARACERAIRIARTDQRTAGEARSDSASCRRSYERRGRPNARLTDARSGL